MKYIGKKQVEAVLCLLGEFIHLSGRDPYSNDPEVHDENEPGYLVTYEDGYKSWCPKDVFEQAYKKAETFTDRMEIELDELKERLHKLQDFYYSPKRLNLSEEKQNLLNAQLVSMENYAVVLLKRINAEKNIPIPHYDPNCCCCEHDTKDEDQGPQTDQGIRTDMMP